MGNRIWWPLEGETIPTMLTFGYHRHEIEGYLGNVSQMVVETNVEYKVGVLDRIWEADSWLQENIETSARKETDYSDEFSSIHPNQAFPYDITGAEYFFENESDANFFAKVFSDGSYFRIVHEAYDDDDVLLAKQVLWDYLDRLIAKGEDPNEVYFGKSLDPTKGYEEPGFQSETKLEELINDGTLIRPLEVLPSGVKEWFEKKLEMFPDEIERQERTKKERKTYEKGIQSAQFWGKVIGIAAWTIPLWILIWIWSRES